MAVAFLPGAIGGAPLDHLVPLQVRGSLPGTTVWHHTCGQGGPPCRHPPALRHTCLLPPHTLLPHL